MAVLQTFGVGATLVPYNQGPGILCGNTSSEQEVVKLLEKIIKHTFLLLFMLYLYNGSL
jgi:hypothetical protein